MSAHAYTPSTGLLLHAIRCVRLSRRVEALSGVVRAKHEDAISIQDPAIRAQVARGEAIRRAGEVAYRAFIAAALVAAATEASKRRKADEHDFDLAIMVILMALASRIAKNYSRMAEDMAGGVAPAATDATAFGFHRAGLLGGFVTESVNSLRKVATEAITEPEAEELTKEYASKIPVDRVIETEAQAAYGLSQFRALQLAGFTHKAWVTMEDEVVRESHNLNSEQGAVPIGERFGNGLLYPGDPAGLIGETINCRCWLVGINRKPIQRRD